MVQISRDILIAHPIAGVFEAMTNPKSAIRWISALYDAEQTPAGPLIVGTETWYLAKVFGQHIRVQGVWTSYEPPASAVFVSQLSPLTVQVTFRCIAEANATRAVFSADLGRGIFFGVGPSTVTELFGCMLNYDLTTLKTLLELPSSILNRLT